MVNLRNALFFAFFVCFLSGSQPLFAQNNEAFRTIWHPAYLGERLDYCTLDGKACGKEVATRYCQLLGYDYSSQNVIAYNVGLTNYLATRAQCKGWRCNGFMSISCAMNLSHTPPLPYHYREKHYAKPRFNNYRVDWCYSQNKDCGARAANSFCSRMGYLQARRYVKETRISATRTIGSEELCFGNQCNAFKSIDCYR